MSRIHPPSRPIAGSSSSSAATRSGRAAARCSATAPPNECTNHQHRGVGLVVEQRGQRRDIGVDGPRCRPRRPAVSEQIGCGDGDLGQVVGQLLPALPVAGQPVQREHPHRTGRTVAVHMKVGVTRRWCQFDVHPASGGPTCRTPVIACRYVLHLGPGGARCVCVPGLRGLVRVLGGPAPVRAACWSTPRSLGSTPVSDPESVLLLTGSGRIGMQARSALTTALLRAQAVHAGPPVIRRAVGTQRAQLRVRGAAAGRRARRRSAARGWSPAPNRTPSSANCWPVISQTVRDAAAAWPADLRPALGTAGFATELRKLLARCAERGVDPQQLERLGRRCGPSGMDRRRPVRATVRAGDAAAGGGGNGGAAGDYSGAGRRRTGRVPRWKRSRSIPSCWQPNAPGSGVLLVDDAQQLDPQAALLVRVLAAGADLALVAGDPNQAVFGFRGARARRLSPASGWCPDGDPRPR